MRFFRVVKEALASIFGNKTRSFLTVLGIVIGVGSVIGMLSIGAGAQDSILGSIESIGTNTIFVMPGELGQVTNAKALTISDVDALSNRMRAPHILRVSPMVMSQTNVSSGENSLTTTFFGSYAEYADISGIDLAEGSFFTQTDIDSRSAAVVIGPDLAEELFGRRSGVVGNEVRINNSPYRVIGVTKAKGGTQFNNPDMQGYMPITTMQMRIVRQTIPNSVSYIIIQAQDSASIPLAIEEAQQILRESHRLSARQENDFTLTNQEDVADIAGQVTGILTVLLSGIAGISLLVGGIGIMNIMLVTVTERTSEIGLRKALGARKMDIMIQFLTESGLLSLIGGILGIGLGWAFSFIIGNYAANSGVPLVPVVQTETVLLATLFSTLVGLFFGWYPAQKAANMEPVEALRHE
ncbi:MAG: ABC transporter permease [Anaerolineaceae bacterium]|nr:ABC transporter permease [Anaerolineaceae bacterium]